MLFRLARIAGGMSGCGALALAVRPMAWERYSVNRCGSCSGVAGDGTVPWQGEPLSD